MASITHGIETSKLRTSVSTPVTVASGVHFVVGTAPVHTVGGKVNEVVMLTTYAEAAELIGYSDDWKKYSLCEEVYTAFSLYGVSPIFVVNVLDAKKHKKEVEGEELAVIDNQIKLPFEAIEDTIMITGKTKDTDYGVIYSDGYCIVEFLENTTGTMTVSYSAVAPEMVDKKDIIGGYDVNTKKNKGFECIDEVFPKYTYAPDLLLCPNWSHDSEVAAIMSAKCEGINGVFDADAILDIDTTDSGVTYYSDAPEWKKKKNFTKTNEIVCFPRLKLGDTQYNFSTQLAGLISQTDQDGDYGDGTPCESASNKSLQADSMVIASGEEVVLDVQKANYLNDNGIVTALNFYNGFVSWGNYTACYPSNTDPVDYFYCISRMFKWVAKTVVLSYWSSLDGKMTRRLIDTILQGINDWLNGLTSEEKILGGRVEFNEDENTTTALMAGKAKFHVFLTPPSPMQKLEFVFEYDISYLTTLFAA